MPKSSPASRLFAADAPPALRAKAAIVLERVTALYGVRPLERTREPLQQLVLAMLSHRTTWADEWKAFTQMWERYGSWAAIQHADTAALTERLAPSRFPEAKAPNIQKVLAAVHAAAGAYTLDFLEEMPTQDALDWLLALPGVGLKTATLLLLFTYHRPVLPVDTHVHRVSARVGLIPVSMNAEKAHAALLALLPAEAQTLYTFHRDVLTHGQQVCTYTAPRCGACALRDICDDAQRRADAAARGVILPPALPGTKA